MIKKWQIRLAAIELRDKIEWRIVGMLPTTVAVKVVAAAVALASRDHPTQQVPALTADQIMGSLK